MKQAVTYIRPATPVEAALAERRVKTIDRYGELDRRAQLHAPDEAEAKVLSAEIQSWHKDSAASKGPTENGEDYQIQLSPKRNERTLRDKRRAFNVLMRALGRDGLIAVIEIPMGVLDKTIPKSAQKAFMSEERSGYRTLTVVALRAAKPEVVAA